MSSTLSSSSERPAEPPGESGSRRDLRDLRGFLARRWKVIAVLAVLGAAVGAVRAAVDGPTYEASASLVFRSDPVLQLAGISQSFQTEGDPTQPGSLMQTQMFLVKEEPVAAAVKRRLGGSDSRADLLDRIRVEQDGVSSLVRVIGQDDTAKGAARLANVWATTFVALRTRELDERITRGRAVLQDELDDRRTPAGRKRVVRALVRRLTVLRAARPRSVEVVSLATPPSQAIGAGPVVSAGIGLLVGLVFGFGAGFVLDQLGVSRSRET